MQNLYRIEFKEVYKIISLIIISMIIGIFFGSLLDIDLDFNKSKVDMLDIFWNNIIIGIILIVLTSMVSYPIIIFNGFFLGLNIFFAVHLFGLKKTFLTLIFHTPLEILGWTVCIIASKRMFIFYKNLIHKDININIFKYILKLIFLLVLIYLIAALLEYYVFEFLGGTQWLH